MDQLFFSFLGVAFLVIVLPGPDTALTIRNTLASGRAGGVATALGVVVGQMVWEVATAAGLTAIVLASERVFHAIKVAGAIYLVFLGAQSLLSAIRSRGIEALDRSAPRRDLPPSRAFQQGVLSNLGNPKMAVFFASVFPQFAPHGRETFWALLSLGLVFSAMTLAWLSLYAVAISRASSFVRKRVVQRTIEAGSGAALLGLGARMALEKE